MKTFLGQFCYVIQDICKNKTCKKCNELKEPDKN